MQENKVASVQLDQGGHRVQMIDTGQVTGCTHETRPWRALRSAVRLSLPEGPGLSAVRASLGLTRTEG